jgi:hypothetical protein
MYRPRSSCASGADEDAVRVAGAREDGLAGGGFADDVAAKEIQSAPMAASVLRVAGDSGVLTAVEPLLGDDARFRATRRLVRTGCRAERVMTGQKL